MIQGVKSGKTTPQELHDKNALHLGNAVIDTKDPNQWVGENLIDIEACMKEIKTSKEESNTPEKEQLEKYV